MLESKGKLYGFETDTVWGLGCLPNDLCAIEKIYEIKNRDRSKPLILMSHDIKNLEKFILNKKKYAELLIEKFFPGALTLIFERSEACPKELCAGFNTIGIRVPNSKNFKLLTRQIEGGVLATTSLNISNEPPCKGFWEAKEKFGKKVEIIEPKYPSSLLNLASTVVLCTGESPVVLRQGSVEIA